MKKANGSTKSDAIRAVLKRKPAANREEIKTALAEQGVKASDALISKIKYGRNGAAKSKAKRGRKAKSSHGSKADAIRAAFSRLGPNARNRDVIAEAAKQGVKVSSAQISALKKSKKTRRGMKAATVAVHSVSLEHLLAAKALADRLGGIDVARQALADLARLS